MQPPSITSALVRGCHQSAAQRAGSGLPATVEYRKRQYFEQGAGARHLKTPSRDGAVENGVSITVARQPCSLSTVNLKFASPRTSSRNNSRPAAGGLWREVGVVGSPMA